MKIGVIYANNLDNCPFFDKYEKLLIENDVQFDKIYWNRDGENHRINQNDYCFK